MEVGPEDTVAMVGHIKPFAKAFRSRAREVNILERSPHREEGVLPDTACEAIIPEADVVVITGSALVNGTMCLPDPLFRMGVDYAGGIRINDPDKAMQILSEGGGTPQLKGAGEFITYRAR